MGCFSRLQQRKSATLIAGSSAHDDADTSTTSNQLLHRNEWSLVQWLLSLDLHVHVASALSVPHKSSDFDFVHKSLSHRSLEASLKRAGLSGLLSPILSGLEALKEQPAATGAALTAKFAADGEAYKGEMGFASLDAYYGGLEGLVGPPRMADGSLQKAMQQEHTSAPDSRIPFETSNGFSNAVPSAEWEFVVAPTSDGTVRYPEREGAHPEWARTPTPLAVFEGRMAEKNAALRLRGHTELVMEELVGGRLYSGPMYEKYNAVLRFFAGPRIRRNATVAPTFLQAKCEQLKLGKWVEAAEAAAAAGAVEVQVGAENSHAENSPALVWRWDNTFPTTLHAINSCVIKLSKLTVVTRLWRGFTGATLPNRFFAPNEDGVCGGVEYGFTSTSVEREQACHYAAGKASTLLQLQQGMVDRGSDISWLSQYPHEKEVLFPPLVGIEVVETRVDGRTLVVDARPSLNMMALTLEQVASRRRKLVLDMSTSMRLEVITALTTAGKQPAGEWNEWSARSDQATARGGLAEAMVASGLALAHDPDWFNNDHNFGEAIKSALETKKRLAKGRPIELDCSRFGWLDVVPDQLAACTAIEAINLSFCSSLRKISEKLDELAHLQSLNLYACKAITSLPDAMCGCVALATLNCQGCTALTVLPEKLGGCRKLRTLNLYGCKLLAALPPSIGGCADLEEISLGLCKTLTTLPWTLRFCEKLKQLNLGGCTGLETMPGLSNLHGTLQCESVPPKLNKWVAGGFAAFPSSIRVPTRRSVDLSARSSGGGAVVVSPEQRKSRGHAANSPSRPERKSSATRPIDQPRLSESEQQDDASLYTS